MLVPSVDLLLLLLGTVIGSIGSMAGSVILGRHELTRAARIRIYRDLLPPMVDATLDASVWSAEISRSQVEALYREGVLAGRGERRLAQSVVDAWHHKASITLGDDRDEEGEWAPDSKSLALWTDANQRLLDALLIMERTVEGDIR